MVSDVDEFWRAYAEDWPECEVCELPAVIETEFDAGVFLHLCWEHGLEELVIVCEGGPDVHYVRKPSWLKSGDELE